jgi:S-adenosylmethionine:tRNA ribosyltransferase-isomerase
MLSPTDFSYNLPENLIANKPEKQRDHCRLLSLNKNNGQIDHLSFFDLINLLGSNDVLVLNQSKVFPARLFGQKSTGGKFEILLLRQLDSISWLAISKPRLAIDQVLTFGHDLVGKVTKSNKDNGQIEIEFNQKHQQFLQTLDLIGHTPLPPYINSTETEKDIRKEYQTVYAKELGSAAAPTAGLHFTKKLLADLKKKGVQIEYVTLHVGLGTFQNLRPENIATKTLHQEFYEIDDDTATRLNLAKQQGKRVIAVGTTSVRTLESASKNVRSCEITPGKSSTQIFIYPPYEFKFVDALITNFHLPESSLLMLVSAFTSKDLILNAYQQAIENEYRFFSFGDAMFIY